MYSVTKPVSFNLFKHHLNYIQERINQVETIDDFGNLKSEIKVIGTSQMDIYTGNLNPSRIAIKVLEKIEESIILTRDKYTSWLNYSKSDYRLIRLDDNSKWVCRSGTDDKERYVHIHPARNSYLTIRVKANALKTAILLLANKKLSKREIINEELIYDIRIKHLNLSPIKSIDKLKELQKLVCIINNQPSN
ncbi:hypothetical protein ACFLTE_11050 [Bacteroidota bacterium]